MHLTKANIHVKRMLSIIHETEIQTKPPWITTTLSKTGKFLKGRYTPAYDSNGSISINPGEIREPIFSIAVQIIPWMPASRGVSLGLSPASIPNFIFAKQRRESRGEGTLQNERWKSCLDEQKWNQSLTHPHGGYFALWIFSKISLLYKLDSFKWRFRSGLYNFSHDHS